MTQRRATILIIDDDPQLVTMLDIALSKAGHDIMVAYDGQEGLEVLVNKQPDLVISDIMMPNMDGVEMFRQIRERLQERGIPIIIMTALSRKSWFNDLEAEGAVIVQKPFDFDFIVNLVSSCLM